MSSGTEGGDMTNKINGVLDAVSLPAGAPPLDFTAYRVELAFTVELISSTDPDRSYRIAQTRRSFCEADGSFAIGFEDGIELADGIADLSVFAPNGQRVFHQSRTQHSLNISNGPQTAPDTTTPIRLEVTPVTVDMEDPRDEVAADTVSGHVIQYCGQQLPEGTPVILWGCEAPPSEPEYPKPTDADAEMDDELRLKPPRPKPTPDHPARDPLCHILDHGQARADGHFEMVRPKGSYHSAHVQWGQRGDQVADVRLDSDGHWPKNLVLVEAINHHDKGEHKDCGCASSVDRLPSAEDLANDTTGTYSSDLGGGCNIQFKPNRTLEEYAFTSFARTTAPEIAREDIGVTDLYSFKSRIRTLGQDANNIIKSLQQAGPEIRVLELEQVEEAQTQRAARGDIRRTASVVTNRQQRR